MIDIDNLPRQLVSWKELDCTPTFTAEDGVVSIVESSLKGSKGAIAFELWKSDGFQDTFMRLMGQYGVVTFTGVDEIDHWVLFHFERKA